MIKTRQPSFFSRETATRIALTILFNTLIAAVIHGFMADASSFSDTLILAQSIGLFICLLISSGFHYASPETAAGIFNVIALGLGAGALAGSGFGWWLLRLIHAGTIELPVSTRLWSTVVGGIVFGIPVTYFFVSRITINAARQQAQEETIKRLTLEKEAAGTNLRLLQAQIEPHFLFNTLSTILSLMDTDTAAAKSMLMDFTGYLRISLSRTRTGMVTLGQELELVEAYLRIYKIRMGRRLTFRIECPDALKEIPFPPLMIQPLVENALKHGLEPLIDGGSVSVACRAEEGLLKVMIRDTGPGIITGFQHGTGIANVMERLKAIYGSRGHLNFHTMAPAGLSAELEVPL